MRNPRLVWRSSQYCANSECVEIADLGPGVALRDSTRADDAVLRFSNADWTAFLADLRRGMLRQL